MGCQFHKCVTPTKRPYLCYPPCMIGWPQSRTLHVGGLLVVLQISWSYTIWGNWNELTFRQLYMSKEH